MSGRTSDRQPAGRNLVALLAIGPATAALAIEAPVPAGTRALVALLWILALLPAYRYFATPVSQRRPLPFFPAVSFMYGVYYALPLTLGSTNQYYNAPVDPQTDYDLPVQLAFFGWIAMTSAYAAGRIWVGNRRPGPAPKWEPATMGKWGLTILYGAILATLLRAYLGHVLGSGGVFQFIVSLEWFGAGLLTALARRRELSRPATIGAVAGIAIAAVKMLAIGSLAPFIMLLAAVGFGMWVGRPALQKSWILASVVLLLTAMAFRGVADDFRRQVWFGSIQLTQSERVGVMYRLLRARVDATGVGATVWHGVTATAGRSANLDLFANVVRRTPSEVPYWGGTTYVSLVGAFIPRFLWRDKPTKELGQAFGHRYGYLHWTNRSTAINLPVLVEFFANFSVAGVILGMFVVGLLYRTLDACINRPGQTPLHSMIGTVLLMPLLLIESDFSLLFGGLPLNALAFAGVWWVLGRLPTAAEHATRERGRVIVRELSLQPLPRVPARHQLRAGPRLLQNEVESPR